jgi:hypothetical protein
MRMENSKCCNARLVRHRVDIGVNGEIGYINKCPLCNELYYTLREDELTIQSLMKSGSTKFKKYKPTGRPVGRPKKVKK